jgi:class 3 adenylate cyclase
MAGVIGKRQYLFDVWGDTVNTAARIEGLGAPDTITLSGSAWAQVASLCHNSGSEIVRVKGKGEMEIYYVDGLL